MLAREKQANIRAGHKAIPTVLISSEAPASTAAARSAAAARSPRDSVDHSRRTRQSIETPRNVMSLTATAEYAMMSWTSRIAQQARRALLWLNLNDPRKSRYVRSGRRQEIRGSSRRMPTGCAVQFGREKRACMNNPLGRASAFRQARTGPPVAIARATEGRIRRRRRAEVGYLTRLDMALIRRTVPCACHYARRSDRRTFGGMLPALVPVLLAERRSRWLLH